MPKIKPFVKKKRTPESVLIEQLKSKYTTIDISKVSKFSDLPISVKTIKGLNETNYKSLTDIQKASIPLALQEKDILGAAQTGSGKTLAFLIPILESLYCERWTHLDGVGALVITPTRELAYQIFETLRKVGKYHDFSAGLIIGGKDLNFERKRMDQCNIVICTPGRLLQHMDENPLFDCSNMRLLVLDEADRCLDMGFKETMNGIIANLPPKRQTLLFSATQTKSVQDLARLSLKDPSYVSVNEMMTPKDLSQSYIECKLEDKLSIIWSFIRHHRKKKIIIFFSTCKQVKYFYEMFCRLRPGLSLLALYGTLHQLRRMKIYEDFCKKSCAVLFATDLAARGLDFPEVHWVLQADCPEDVATYIHRVGRTARYHKGGESLLLLMPSELKMVEYLEEKKIPVEKIEVNPAKLETPLRKMDLFISKDEELKSTAQRAVSHYAKATYLMKDKSIFNVRALDLQAYAHSLGLAAPPRVRFLDRAQKRQNATNDVVEPKVEDKKDEQAASEDDNALKHSDLEKLPVGLRKQFDNNDSDEDSDPFEMCTNFDIKDAKGFKSIPKSNGVSATPPIKNGANTKIVFEENLSENEARVEPTKPLLSFERTSKVTSKPKVITKAALVKKMKKTGELSNRKIVFNDEGEAISVGPNEKKSDLAKEFEMEAACGIDIEKTKSVLREEDKFDRRSFNEKLKAKRKEEKMKLKAKLKKEREEKDGGDEDSDEDDAPDLTWLPDPNKVYDDENNPTNGDETKGEDRLQKETNSITDSEHIKEKKAVKKKNKKRKAENTPVKRSNKLAKLGRELDVAETEALTLMLLKGKN